MSKEEIKIEINRVLDHFSNDALSELLAFLKELDGKKCSIYNSETLHQILEEDSILLKKLAQ
jgi:hypothetical protein